MSEQTVLCGVCGRPLGRFKLQRGPLSYNVWRHVGDLTGLVPHEAVVGVPGRRATVEEMTAALGDADAGRDLWDLIYGRNARPKRVHHHREDIPAPRVPARLANDDEIPSSARSLIALAAEHGWEVKVVYALGPLIAAEGYAVLREVESISVRARRGGQRVVSCWEKPWSPDGPIMVTKKKPCKGCKKTGCTGCQLGTGALEEIVEAGWEHSGSFLVTPATAPAKLADVQTAIKMPEAYCHTCGAVLGNHVSDGERYLCPIPLDEGVA